MAGIEQLLIADDGWAIASHIALSVLMALFPFLIIVTALAGFLGTKELADQAAQLLLDAWPRQVANRSPRKSIMCSPPRAATC